MRLVSLLCFGTVAVGSVAGAQEAGTAAPLELTEAEAVARAVRGNPRVDVASAWAQVTQAEQTSRRLWPNPEVSYSRESVADIRDSFVVMRQELPVWGPLGHLRAAGRFAVDAANFDRAREIARLRIDVRRAFTSVLAWQQREDVLSSNVGTLRQLIGVLLMRERAGEGSTYDRLRGERELADRMAALGEASVERMRAAVELAALLGDADLGSSIAVRGDLLPPRPSLPLDEALARSLASRADLLAAEAAVERYALERRAAGTLRFPTPTVGGGMKRTDAGATAATGYQFSLDLRVPLFDTGQARRALADAEGGRAAAEAAWTRRRIATDVRTAYAGLQQHLDRATTYRTAVDEVADPLARTARLSYEEGEIGILELLDAERQLVEADLRAINLALAARQAAIELDWAMGVEDQP